MSEQPKTIVPDPQTPSTSNSTTAPVIVKKCSVLTYLLAIVGGLTILFWIVLFGIIAYVWFADPFGIRDFVKEQKESFSFIGESFDESSVTPSGVTVGEMVSFDIPAEQEEMLANVGIDVEEVKAKDVAVLEACIDAKLGDGAFDAYAAGERDPSLGDAFALKSCL